MNATATATGPAAPSDRERGQRSLISSAWAGVWASTRLFRPVLVLLILLVIALSLAEHGFLTLVNLESIATSASILWLIALGATFVVLSGGIDLSSGAVAAICGICLAKLLGTALPGVLVIILVVVFGAALGAIVNGIPVGIFGLNVFVVTLASMTAITGAVSLWSHTNSIYVSSGVVNRLAVSKLFGVPMPIWIMLITLLLFLLVQTRTYFGRDIYAVGGSMTAAKLSGIRTSRTLICVYAVAGGMAALAGIIAVGQVGAADPVPDNTLPLNAIAAILIGGTALAGGIGGVGGTVLGVLFLGALQNGLSLSGVSTAWQQIVTGIILVAAVLADRLHLMPGWGSARRRVLRRSPPGQANPPAVIVSASSAELGPGGGPDVLA
jgi:ribose transport system permease protein